MDYIEAQRLISEQLDREPIDALTLEEAKNHCRGCEECSGYIRTLVALRQSPLPEPSPELPQRVMQAVAEAAAADAALRAAQQSPRDHSPATAPDSAPEPTPVDSTEPSIDKLLESVRDRRNRRAVVAWVSAAALIFVVAGVGALTGLRTILAPPTQSRATSGDMENLQYASPAAGVAEEAPAPPAADQSAKSAVPAASAPGYIVVNGLVYRETGVAAGVDKATLKVVGSTTSSLGGSTVTSRDALGTSDASRVYVADDDEQLLAFERVTRTFGGRQYALASAASLTRYGDWPTLPTGVPLPSNLDGTPEYVSAGTDSNGVEVYRRVGADGSKGIAVAPGTPTTDPAAGNPNWTWWQTAP